MTYSSELGASTFNRGGQSTLHTYRSALARFALSARSSTPSPMNTSRFATPSHIGYIAAVDV